MMSQVLWRLGLRRGAVQLWKQSANTAGVVRLASSDTTIDHEATKFSYQDWWDEQSGPAYGLHSMNGIRVPLIARTLLGQSPKDITSPYDRPRPLEGFSVLEIGCGARILCEPVARLGAEVTGIEPQADLTVARNHASCDPELRDRLHYEKASVEEFAEEKAGQFDLVVASEVVEHVTNLKLFVQKQCSLVKPGGHAVFTTFNRTFLSYVIGIVLLETITGILPPGTHEWDKFVTPGELSRLVEGSGLEEKFRCGMQFILPANKWQWIDNDSVNYALTAFKPLPKEQI